MAGGNFFGRLAAWVANELIVDRLANNPSFQRFAVRTARTIEDAAAKGQQAKGEIMEKMNIYATAIREEVEHNIEEAQRHGWGNGQNKPGK